MNQFDLRPASLYAENMGGIYCLQNVSNDKRYIGSAVNIKSRLKNHKKMLTANMHPNKHLQSAWNNSSFEFFCLEEVSDKNKLLEREQYWIDHYQSANNEFGYNKRLKANSNLGLKSSLETREKIRLFNIGHTRNKGQIISPETRAKISTSMKGKKHTQEHVEKRRQARKGKPISEEQKAKISKTLTGKKHPLGYKKKPLVLTSPPLMVVS